MGNEDTQVMHLDTDNDQRTKQAMVDFEIMTDAMELLVELWPHPGYATIAMETHQWRKLRRVLIAQSRLWVEAYQR